jgi:hypothetical protein
VTKKAKLEIDFVFFTYKKRLNFHPTSNPVFADNSGYFGFFWLIQVYDDKNWMGSDLQSQVSGQQDCGFKTDCKKRCRSKHRNIHEIEKSRQI